MKVKFLGLFAALTVLFSLSFLSADAQDRYRGERRHGQYIKHPHNNKHLKHGHSIKMRHRHGIKGRSLTLRERRSIDRYHKQAIREHKRALKINKHARRMETHYGYGR